MHTFIYVYIKGLFFILVIHKGRYKSLQHKEILMSYAGLKALEEELDNLKSVKRKEIAEKIKVAISFGDLSENSEYDSAKNEQAFVEARIVQLEKMLTNVKVIDESELSTDVVGVGCKVKLKDLDFDMLEEYSIVSSNEADITLNKISDESPVGAAIVGKGLGDKVSVSVPSGIVINYEIIEIGKQDL